MSKLILPGHINPASDEKEETLKITGSDLMKFGKHMEARLMEIIAKASYVAYADEDGLMPAVEALRETFLKIAKDRNELNAMAEDMH